MKKNLCVPHGCALRMNRRQFISTCSACAALASSALLSESCSKKTNPQKKTLRVIYSLHDTVQPQPDWPNVGFDFAPVMQTINERLAKSCPEFIFLPTQASGAEEAERILKDQSEDIFGYIVFQMNCWNRVVQTIAATGKPVLYVDFQYGGSGGFLVYTAAFLRANAANVGFVASSDMDDLVQAVKCFDRINTADDFATVVSNVRRKRTPIPTKLAANVDECKTLSAQECLARMQESKILAIRDQDSGPADPIFTIPMEKVAFAEVNAAWERADKEKSNAIAERWQNTAEAVIDVPFETLLSSAAFYLGMKDVMKAHNANAITINCLGGFYGGHIHAYPCLGFHELNNEGLIGACECDTRSTATMVAFSQLTQGRPGYISDPVMDTAKRQIIYAHCVASNKVFGPNGQSNPFTIMTHSEDRQGASVRSILPLGYMTTTLEIMPDRKEILFHQGVAVENDPDDRACRTKLAVEPVGDIEKLFTMWDRCGWHRVTFYGDLKEPVYELAGSMGWSVVEEA